MNSDEIKDPAEGQEIKIGDQTESTEDVVIISEEVEETKVEEEEELEADKISLEEIIEFLFHQLITSVDCMKNMILIRMILKAGNYSHKHESKQEDRKLSS